MHRAAQADGFRLHASVRLTYPERIAPCLEGAHRPVEPVLLTRMSKLIGVERVHGIDRVGPAQPFVESHCHDGQADQGTTVHICLRPHELSLIEAHEWLVPGQMRILQQKSISAC